MNGWMDGWMDACGIQFVDGDGESGGWDVEVRRILGSIHRFREIV